MLGNLMDNETLIAHEDDNSSMVDFVGGSTESSIRGSSTSVGRGVSFYNDINSTATSNSSSSRASASTMIEGSGSA